MIFKDGSDKPGCHLLLLSSRVLPPPSEEEEEARGDGRWQSPSGMLGGRKAGGRQRHGRRSATQRAGLLAARQGQTVTSRSQDGKRGLLTAPSRAKSAPRDAVYRQERAEAQPSLCPPPAKRHCPALCHEGAGAGKRSGAAGGPQPWGSALRHREGLRTSRSIIWKGKCRYEEEGTSPPSPSLRPQEGDGHFSSREELSRPPSACNAKNAKKIPMGSSHRPTLSSSKLILTSPSVASSGSARPLRHLPWAKRGKKVLRPPEGQEGLLQAPLGTEGEMRMAAQSPGGRHWRGLWESLYLICFSLFKNKLRSSGRGEVGGNTCAGGEGGRAGQRPAARKTTPHRSPRARKKAVEHPHGQEAPEPGKSRRQSLHGPSSCHGPQLCTPTAQGAPRYAAPCTAGKVLGTLLGGGREGGWDENKTPWEHGPAQSAPG